MSYFEYQSQQIFYQEIGEGEPLVLLHGNTASSKMYAHVVADYAKHYKVILIDFLGHGASDRLQKFPVDLWYEEAKQVIHFLTLKNYSQVNLLGSSGGALVAMNIGLERPDLVRKIIADSFEGEVACPHLTANLVQGRQLSKQNPGACLFYEAMQGPDWEQIVDLDTQAVAEHARTIKQFFHHPLKHLKADILLVGSCQDELMTNSVPHFYQETYTRLLDQIGHGQMLLFKQGGHPAMASNQVAFVAQTLAFLK